MPQVSNKVIFAALEDADKVWAAANQLLKTAVDHKEFLPDAVWEDMFELATVMENVAKRGGSRAQS